MCSPVTFKPSPIVSERRIAFGSIPSETNHCSLGLKPNEIDKNFFYCTRRDNSLSILCSPGDKTCFIAELFWNVAVTPRLGRSFRTAITSEQTLHWGYSAFLSEQPHLPKHNLTLIFVSFFSPIFSTVDLFFFVILLLYKVIFLSDLLLCLHRLAQRLEWILKYSDLM